MTKYIIFIVLILASFTSVAGSVIVHPDNNSKISELDIERLFLAKIESFSDGKKAIAVDQNGSSAIRNQFIKVVLKRSPRQLNAYYAKLLFTGKGTPPKPVGDDAEIIEKVANNIEMIGYVTHAPTDGSVKVVYEF